MLRARDSAFIRKLCGLGLPAETLAQCLLPALRGLIPSHSAGVFWVDTNGEMVNLYAEKMLTPDAMAAYYDKHYGKVGEGFAAAFRRRAQSPNPVSSQSFTEEERRSDYFRDVMQPLDAHHVLYGILRDGSRPYGQISLYRGRADAAFENADLESLGSLLRYLSSSLVPSEAEPRTDGAYVVVEEALGVASSVGSIASAPAPWSKLLRLAFGQEVSPRNAAREREGIEGLVQSICANEAKGGLKTSGASLIAQSAWGRFVVRTFRLPDANGRRCDQIGILIRREEAQVVSLVRGSGLAALSPQQCEVALLLAQGKSNREIAEELRLRLNTTNYHVKQVYAKLSVNDRNAVQGRLLQIAQAAAAR